VAVVARSQTRPASELTWGELAELVARVRTGLLAADIQAGDRVAGYLPNIPEALAAMLACASIGAIWTCCAPEMGVTGVVDRLSQVEPAVLVSVDGYYYGHRSVDRRTEAVSICNSLPSVRKSVWLPYLGSGNRAPSGWDDWEAFVVNAEPIDYAALDFDHPLYILFSSGTTGQPKPIVHGHGGILLEHAKALKLHFDLGPDDRFFWFSTTGWMMWNFCVSGLLAGAAVVLFDGDPNWPETGYLWDLIESTGTTCAGLGASYLVANMKAGVHPSAHHDLSRLKTLGATGSPLPATAAEWAYSEVSDDLMLASFSGGTDVCTGFVGTSPLHPVWAGEISCPCLGAKVEVFDDDGRSIVGHEGELVLTGPLPSMPVRFWADDGTRYTAAYFSRFPGVWAHGDRAVLTERGTFVITGRSDGTLNRGGVRMGTAEFYSVVEGFPEVIDSLVVHLDDPTGGPGELWLFLVEEVGADADAVAQRVRAALRRELSPRYVPDRFIRVTAVPRTLSGKKLEVPVKRLLLGTALTDALALTSVANPESLVPFLALSEERVKHAGGQVGEQ
jgi:acetoacetyl-CoA synthetase